MASKLKQQLMENKRNIFYASIILATHFAYGIVANILGAVQVDLRFIYDVSINTSSYFTVAVQVGYLLGSLFGWLYRWINRQLALAIFILIMGITSALTPHYQHFWVILAAFVLCGIASGAWDAASGFWMVEIFPVGNAGPLQFMQFMYGGGTVLAPLLAGPFVKGEKTFDSQTGRNITAADRQHSLTVPFILTGVLPAAITTSLLLLYVFCRYQPFKVNQTGGVENAEKSEKVIEEKEVLEDAVVDESTVPNRMLKVALCGICLAAYSTIELGWFNFSTTMYQYLEIHLDATTATHMQSIVSATYTLGRLTTTFIAAKLKPDIIISYHYLTMIVGFVTIFLGRNSQLVITVGSAILGYGLSAMWPAILAFTERHLRLSNRICSIYSFLAGLLSLVVPFILGQTFNAHPTMLFLIEAGFVSTSLGAFILVKILIFRDTGRLL